ncbi:MAG: hypothetical protein ACXAC5_01690 [Promethearchaeota archaeon]|jgi:hypothetical protein
MSASFKFTEGMWVIFKPGIPSSLKVFGRGPFQIVKILRPQRTIFLRGQQDFQISFARALKWLERCPAQLIQNPS